MSKTEKDKKNRENDSVFSKNHSKNVRYRLRRQQEQEAEQEVKEYYDEEGRKIPREWLNYGGTD